MEDLQEEVDALFELTDQLFFAIWHRIAAQVIEPEKSTCILEPLPYTDT